MSAPSPYQIEQALSAWMSVRARLLHEDPDLAGDQSVLTELLATEATDVREIIARLIRAAIESDMQAAAVDGRIAELEHRSNRWRNRERAAKSAAFAIMEAIGFPPIQEPDFTASKNNGRPGVHIVDETKLPDRFVTVTRTPKKGEIGIELAAGGEVPGAVRTNPVPYLTIRRK